MGRRALYLLAVALAALAAGACSHAGARKSTVQPAGSASVDRVVDGDTIIVRVSGRRERVRLIGIDTPESVKPNTPVQCFAIRARAFCGLKFHFWKSGVYCASVE